MTAMISTESQQLFIHNDQEVHYFRHTLRFNCSVYTRTSSVHMPNGAMNNYF